MMNSPASSSSSNYNNKHRSTLKLMTNASNSNSNSDLTLTNGGGTEKTAFKKDIACGPGSVREFFLMFFLGCSRKILGVRAEHKLALYLVFVFIGSIFAELFTMPKDFVLQRMARPLNTFVIRFGYGWVLAITFPLVLLTTRIYSRNNSVTTFANFGRLVFNTMAWFVVTSTFFWYYSAKGMCVSLAQSNTTHTTIKNLLFGDCRKSGYQWSGFDISGHTFLLVFCNLILLEEAKVMKLVDKVLQQLLQQQQQSVSSIQTSAEDGVLSKREKMILQGVLCLAAMTSVAYDYLLFVTVFYYHTILEKMLAFVSAICCWYGLYRFLYPRMAIHPGTNTPAAGGQQSHSL